MNGNVAVKSFSGFQVNEVLLAKVVGAIKKGEADARRYSQIRSFEIYYDGYRERLVLGRIMVIPAKIADSLEDFPAALLYGAMVREIHPELQADLYSYRLGESEFDEYDKRGLQVIKDKLFKDPEGKYRSIVLFLPTWGNVRDHVIFKFNRDTEILTAMVRQQVYGAYFNPALSSAFDHLSNDTDKLDVSDITPKVNYPGMSGHLTSFPELHAGDGGDSASKTASAAKPRILLAADSVDAVEEEFLEPGERAVIDSLAEDLKGKIDGEQKTPAEAAKQAKLAAIENLSLILRTAFEKVQKFQIEGEMDQGLIQNALDLLMSIEPTLEDQTQQRGVSSAIKHLDDYMIYEGGEDENLARAYTELEDLIAEFGKVASTDDTGATTGLRSQPDYNEADSHVNEANAAAMKGAAKKAGLEWGFAQGDGGITWKVFDRTLLKSKVIGEGTCPDKATAELELQAFIQSHQNQNGRPMGMLASKQAAKVAGDWDPNWKPDWFDLNDYILVEHPEVYAATKYLSQPEQMKVWGQVYEKDPSAREKIYAGDNLASKQAARGAEQKTYNGWRNAVKKICPTATFDGDKDICSAYDKAGKKDIGEWDGAVGKIYSKEASAKTVVACEGATLFRTGNTFILKAASGHTEPLRINASKVKWQRPLQFTLAFRAAVAAFVRNPTSEVNKTADVNLDFDSIWNDITEPMGPAPVVEVEGTPKETINPEPGPDKTESTPKPEEASPKTDSEPKIESNAEQRPKEAPKAEAKQETTPAKPEKGVNPFAKKEGSRKRAAFDMFIPGQVLDEFYPELLGADVEYPAATPMGGNGYDPGLGLHGGNPSGVTESADGLPSDGEPYISTDPVAAMGIGNNGKPHILEGAPLSTELDIRGYGFDQEFYAHGGAGINSKAFTAKLALYPIKKNASVEEWKAQFGDFLKKAMGEVAATFIAAFKVTSRPLMNKVPGTGEIKLDEMEHLAMFPTTGGQINVSSRVAYLMSKLTDSQIKEAINNGWAQASVWNTDSNGGYTYEVFCRPQNLDKETMVLSYEFVVGTKGL